MERSFSAIQGIISATVELEKKQLVDNKTQDTRENQDRITSVKETEIKEKAIEPSGESEAKADENRNNLKLATTSRMPRPQPRGASTAREERTRNRRELAQAKGEAAMADRKRAAENHVRKYPPRRRRRVVVEEKVEKTDSDVQLASSEMEQQEVRVDAVKVAPDSNSEKQTLIPETSTDDKASVPTEDQASIQVARKEEEKADENEKKEANADEEMKTESTNAPKMNGSQEEKLIQEEAKTHSKDELPGVKNDAAPKRDSGDDDTKMPGMNPKTAIEETNHTELDSKSMEVEAAPAAKIETEPDVDDVVGTKEVEEGMPESKCNGGTLTPAAHKQPDKNETVSTDEKVEAGKEEEPKHKTFFGNVRTMLGGFCV